MGMTITKEQNSKAASASVSEISERFSDAGVVSEVVTHSNGKQYEFVRITCPPKHWRAVAKWLKYDNGVNNCSMITGTHFPEGDAERGWEVAVHLHRWPIENVAANNMLVHVGEKLEGLDIPMEYEVFIPIAAGDSPSVPSVQDIWIGAGLYKKIDSLLRKV